MGYPTEADRANANHLEAALKSIKKYQGADTGISLFQVLSTFSLLLSCYVVIYVGLKHGWWSALLLTPLATGLSMRVFVLQHDCGHGSLFKRRWANDLTGRLCSLLTLTPYDHWKRHHGLHHGGWNNMDTRGRMSDLYSDCITVAEYRKMSRFQKYFYRISNNPLISLIVMPPVIFFIAYRIAFETPGRCIKERVGVYLTNLSLVLIFAALSLYVGWKQVALVTFMVVYPASVIGVWMFALQHKFGDVQWSATSKWTTFNAALKSTSFLRLSRVLRWFTADIGTHHVHHAAPGIPNYRLVACHNAHAVFHDVKILGIRTGIHESRIIWLWDEESKKMVNLRLLT